MGTISAEIVVKIWQAMDQLDADEAIDLSNEMAEESKHDGFSSDDLPF